MIVTEEEAKTKRCQESYPAADGLSPHGFTEVGVATTLSQMLGAGAYSARQTAPSYCIGSACMAWRWDVWNLDPTTGQRLTGKAGYCGKAGRP